MKLSALSAHAHGCWGDGGLPCVLEGVRMSLGDGEEKAFA